MLTIKIPAMHLFLGFFCFISLNAESAQAVEDAPFCPASYAYVLQAENLADTRDGVVKKLVDSKRDLIILDAWFNSDGRWSREEIDTIRAAKPGRRVVCYFSIGEAENYRPYWQAGWVLSRPDFLLSENPDWPGNFKVRYWDKDWQKIIHAELQQIIAVGFDGVMLDIVDGFEFFEQSDKKYIDNKVNPLTGNTYRRDMVDFVESIADESRKIRPDFLVIPQNGCQLMVFPEFRLKISAQALESLFTDDNKLQPPEHTSYVMSFLRPFMDNGGVVLLTEYCKKGRAVDISRRKAKQFGLVLLQTNRALDVLGESFAPGSRTGKCAK